MSQPSPSKGLALDRWKNHSKIGRRLLGKTFSRNHNLSHERQTFPLLHCLGRICASLPYFFFFFFFFFEERGGVSQIKTIESPAKGFLLLLFVVVSHIRSYIKGSQTRHYFSNFPTFKKKRDIKLKSWKFK